jgi:hypothetical protein
MVNTTRKANQAGAGNGAGTLSFHVERLGRAVPDLCRSAGMRDAGAGVDRMMFAES